LQYVFFGSMWQGVFAEPAVTTDELAPLVGMLLAESAMSSADVAAAEPSPSLPWASIVVPAALLCSLTGLVWLWRMWRRLTCILKTRCPETDPRVLSVAATMATHLGLHQSPHISRAQGLSTP